MTYKSFYDIDHARRYLSGSLVRAGLDNSIHYIDNVSEGDRGIVVTATPDLPTLMTGSLAAWHTYRVNGKNLNLDPIPLGLVNFTATNPDNGRFYRICVFTTRMPKRQWRVGLTERTFKAHICNPDLCRRKGIYVDARNVLYSNDIQATAKGEYPSIRKALKLIEQSKRTLEVAFSRRFYIDRQRDIRYKWFDKPVGVFDESNQVVMKKSSQYLEEALFEDMK